MRKRIRTILPLFAAIVFGAATAASGQEKLLRVSVVDLEDRPIKGVELTLGGASSTETTNDDGKARFALAPQTLPGNDVQLRIVNAPKDFVFISPWDKRVHFPQFRNASDNAVTIVLAERGVRRLLEDSRALKALAATINYNDAPGSSAETLPELRREATLAEAAKSFQLSAGEMVHAIKAWGEKSGDPFEKALADLTVRNYPAATAELLKSREMRRAEFEKKKDELFEVNFFLGRSLSGEGKYQASADAYREALALRNEDRRTLNNLAVSLESAGKYAEAESLYQRSLAVTEKTLGKDHPEVALTLNNLAVLYKAQDKYAEAELLYQRSLAITEKALGKDHPEVAVTLNNLASLYQAQGKYAEAQPLYQRSLATTERALGKDHPSVAVMLNNLAALYQEQGKHKEVEPLYQRSLAIREKTLGKDHPSIATTLNNLARLYELQGRHNEAEPLYKRALAIVEKALGDAHPNVATVLENYAELLSKMNRAAEAAKLEERAKSIRANHTRQNPKK